MTLRYDRHLRLLGYQPEMQEILRKKNATIVGVGGVGTALATALVASGIGMLTIIDDDIIELSNLNRQFLYTANDIGKSKVSVAKKRLIELNPEVVINEQQIRILPNNAKALISKTDVVAEGVDNFGTRKLINKICVQEQIPYIHASAQGYQGQVMTIIPNLSACFECVFPDLPETKRTSFPILSMAANLAGTWGAAEVFKIVCGYGEPLTDKMMLFDMKNCISKIVTLNRRLNCTVCGSRKEGPKLYPLRCNPIVGKQK